MKKTITLTLGTLTIMAVAAIIASSTPPRLQAKEAGPIIYSHAYCPTTGGTSPCYFCNNPPTSPPISPGGAGCEFGQPPSGTVVSACLGHSNPNSLCTQTDIPCGDYKMCTSPFNSVGTCTPTLTVCQ